MQDLLYDRSRTILTAKGVVWVEKKMMGGLTFMVDEKMCFGEFQGGLLCRIAPGEREMLLQKEGAGTMSQGGREMKGYVHVQPEGFASYEQLEFWIDKCLAFNPHAKSRKKKKS